MKIQLGILHFYTLTDLCGCQ